MSLPSSNIPTSSSDDSDNEKLHKSTECNSLETGVKKRRVSPGGKTCSLDDGDVIVGCGSGSEKESGTSRDSDSSISTSNYPLPSRKHKTPEKQKNVAVQETDSILQPDSCCNLTKYGRFTKCRECFKTADTNLYSCRFYHFRKVRCSKNKLMYPDGFTVPSDATEEERNLWLPDMVGTASQSPNKSSNDDHLDFNIARFIVLQVGDQFCSLLRQEEDALNLHMGEDDFIAWKKPMKGVREMCDVCKTTLFNFHWACDRCGFVVCIDCYKTRKSGVKKTWMVKGQGQDEWKWLHCTTRSPHEQENLMLCQIIAGDCLKKLGVLVHLIRDMYDIPQTCGCPPSSNSHPLPKINMERVEQLRKSDPLDAIISFLEGGPRIENGSVQQEEKMIEEARKQKLPSDEYDVAFFLPASAKDEDSSDSDDEVGQPSRLRDLLVPNNSVDCSNGNGPSITRFDYTPHHQLDKRTSDEFSRLSNGSVQDGARDSSCHKYSPFKQPRISSNSILDHCITGIDEDSKKPKELKAMQYFVRRTHNVAQSNQNQHPPRVMTKAQSDEMYPGVPHSWLCDGMLLRLIDPSHCGNYRIFQDQWRRGQPVIVGNMTKRLKIDLWHPSSFCKDFGEERNDLINCSTGNLVPNRPMKEFWEGFENFSKRLKDERGNPMLLKLKDWPPGEDFAELLPERFNDLMQALPLAEYTRRTGRLNLASCLPDFFVRPDLGPKMYNAYGSALFPTKGTTNLHLDISDAVNFMVYVGIPSDADYGQHVQEAFSAIDEAGCDDMTRRRVRIKGEMPGALWHIYHASDADKIRDLLNKVAIDRGTRLEPHHDPIHDQSWYLDSELRDRLYKEYNVTGYAIVQCLGDAVFIPAGAPHQVRNLHNCVKVAEDFVSPENVSHCFHLTQEFRDLSDTHTNHEDKLQIKNIIYHTIKSAVSSLFKPIIVV